MRATSSNAGTLPVYLASEIFKEDWKELPKKVEVAIPKGPEAIIDVQNEVKRRDRGTIINTLISETNMVMEAKIETKLFSTLQLVLCSIKEIYTMILIYGLERL